MNKKKSMDQDRASPLILATFQKINKNFKQLKKLNWFKLLKNFIYSYTDNNKKK